MEASEENVVALRNEVLVLKETVDLLMKEIDTLKAQLHQQSTVPSAQPAVEPSQVKPKSYKEAANPSHIKNIPVKKTPSVQPKSAPSAGPRSQPKASADASGGWIKVEAERRAKDLDKHKKSMKDLTKEEKLKILLRTPRPLEERTSGVTMVTARLPLSSRGQAHPMSSWRQILKEVCGVRPLHISLINPSQGEIFIDSKDAEAVKQALSKGGFLANNLELVEKDLERRKQVYLSGYFLPLRREALQGFSPKTQLNLLDLAMADLVKMSDPLKRKQWKYQIAKDRSWVEGLMEI